MSLSKSFRILACVLLLSVLFSGCSYSGHLKDLVIVEGVGIDEKENGVDLSLQTLNVGINNGSQTPEGNMTINTDEKGRNILDAVLNMSKSLSKRVFFGQNKIVVIGDALAKKDFVEHLDYFSRSSDSRPDVAFCVSKSSARDIIESKENEAQVPCENILYLISNNEKSGLSVYVTANDVINLNGDKTSDIYLPALETDKDRKNVNTCGIALFSKSKLVYITDDDETMGFVLMMGKPQTMMVEVENEEYGKIGVKLSNIRCKKSISVENGGVVFNAQLEADMIIDEVEGGINTGFTKEGHQKIAALVEDNIKKNMEKAFNACQACSSDSMRVGELLAKDSPASYKLLSDEWDYYFKTVKINPTSKINIKKITDNTKIQ